MTAPRLPLVFACLLAAAAYATELSVGDAVPDCQFINEQGQGIRLHNYKRKALVLTFIFTRCPLPDYCPRMTVRFAEVQHELAKDPAMSKTCHLLSLSFDPKFDTPERLLAYAQLHHADSALWTFATAASGVVSAFGAPFGLEVTEKEGLLNHNLRTVVIDKDGRVQCIFQGNDWTAQDLLWELRKASR